MSKLLIVTGGAGFIGCNLVKALNVRGYENILVVDQFDDPARNRNLEGVKFKDRIDKKEFILKVNEGKEPHAEAIFHLGACSSTTETDWNYLLENNLNYTRELCEWSLRTGARFIYASSAATYGDGALGYSDADAVTPTLKPLNLYGKSKQDFDVWALKQGMMSRIAGLKYFNVYGPYEDHKGEMRSLINKAYTQILRDGEISLFKSHRPDYKDGEQERDFIHVEDAVKMTLFFYDHPEVSGLYNCGTGVARTWLDLARSLFSAMDREPKIRFIDMPMTIRDKYQYHTRAEMEKMRTSGYTAPILDIEQGIRKYVKEYLELHLKGKLV